MWDTRRFLRFKSGHVFHELARIIAQTALCTTEEYSGNLAADYAD
jgi:hypothetical protein